MSVLLFPSDSTPAPMAGSFPFPLPPLDTSASFAPPQVLAMSEVPIDIVRVGYERMDIIRHLNTTLFDEERVINSFDREDLLMLLACTEHQPIGFKIGYRENRHTYYSAKGGVLAAFRRQGVARALLHAMLHYVEAQGYLHFAYDTFPNMNPGMTILGLTEGFRVRKADYNPVYKDYRLRLEKRLS
ncbi:MAG: GNAT family N-acetyltransferase [Bacteroidota bacterium]